MNSLPIRYRVKEIVYTLQGEGAQAGRVAVFCRFAGCNLWSGREEDRQEAVCQFCDTDFLGADGPGGGEFASADELAAAIASAWKPREERHEKARLVVFTGGEPLLQLDVALVDAVHARGFEAAVETNGTLDAPANLDWVCVSPKAGTALRITRGDELKLIYPQPGAPPESYAQLEFRHFFLQPMDGPDLERNTQLAVEYCRQHPHWRISLQLHKLLKIP
jgi:7-carboxy-7-deazaguanine synthase